MDQKFKKPVRRILLSNDDGFDAIGLGILYKIACQFTSDVWVVAPTMNRSGASRSITLRKDVSITEVETKRFRCSGTPADCIIYGITKILDAKFAREPKTWVREMHDRSVLYLRGLPPGRDLEGAIGLAIGNGHQVILTLDQLNCFQEGCGVHLRKSDGIQEALECLKALDRPWPLTSGIRDESDIERQRDWPSDAVFISPVRQTSSHFGIPALGWNRFSELACDLGVPAYALGGMTKSDIEVVKRYWGFGVAGISEFQ